VLATLLDSVKGDAPREHLLVYEVARSLIRARLPVVPLLAKHMDMLGQWLDREEDATVVLSLYAHIARQADSDFL
jgi:hypothetical protein